MRRVKNLAAAQKKAGKLDKIFQKLGSLKEAQSRELYTFDEFLHEVEIRPEIVLRNIYQLFHDMVTTIVGEGIDEYPDDTESVGFLKYATDKIFVENCDNPFFADRLFSNRFMRMVRNLVQIAEINRIYLYEGPPGSGKSTFLNNLLMKFEEFTKTPEGTIYNTIWHIDTDRIYPQSTLTPSERKLIHIACPNQDNPILQIPRSIRKQFLDSLISDKNFKEKLFSEKAYEWVLKDIPCSICNSIFNALLDKVGDPIKVLRMVHARRAYYSRQFGEGISVFNPGDPLITQPITQETTQKMLNEIFKNDDVKFKYSYFANTNNGIYALMDIKENNIQRLMSLHGIISDGVHKVELIEEKIRTLFVGLVNPEDKRIFENIKSFQDRIVIVNIPYVLDYNTEIKIYANKFGNEIFQKFLPGVLEHFARIIISSRLEKNTPAIKEWIGDYRRYSRYVDSNLFLLKMEIYAGNIPDWLSENDLKKFDRKMRKKILLDSETEGMYGISGRQSINIFNDFYNRYASDNEYITMEMVYNYFEEKSRDTFIEIPKDFLDSIKTLYNYQILQQMKDCAYQYNQEQITNDILNYLYAINFDIGQTIKCGYTGEEIHVTEDFFKHIELMLLGAAANDETRKIFRKDVHNEYITVTLSKELRIEKKKITETSQFKNLFEKYTKNLKENVLVSFTNDENFRRAIKEYGTPSFNSHTSKIKNTVKYMLDNMVNRYKYPLSGAQAVCLYIIDNKLDEKYR